jgi:phthiodiolone/phenolphthiodiolone dimycocerosates ketoreductase
MAACAEAADPALIGVCVTDAVRRMPATLVQAAMSLDHLARGRVVIGLGAGEWANYGPYGWAVESPARRLEEAAAQMRRLLDAPDDGRGQGAVMGLRAAPGSAGPQLWIAAHGPRGFATTGRHGDGWIPNFLALDAWQAGRRTIREAAIAAGRDPDAVMIGLSCQVVIQDTHADTHRLLEHPVLKAFCLLLPPERFEEAGAAHPLGGGGLHHMVASRDGASQLEAALAVPPEVATAYFVHGTVDEVEARIRAYEGVQHVILWDPVPLADLDAARASARGVAELARRLRAATPA